MKWINRRLGALALGLSMFASGVQAQDAVRVHTASGDLAGVREGAVSAFLGVPFAAPPVGPNRWRAPQPVTPWTGVRSAVKFGANCMQAVDPKGFGPWSHEYVVQDPASEDCLYLNVWTPSAKPDARMPVLVWIHGGGFSSGSGSVPIYQGDVLAKRGVVVVTINYRVGAFGFMAHPELTREAAAAGTPPGNYGLQDMQAALTWVRQNIAGFGGDPQNVTIAGQSAGSMAVQTLVVSPKTKGLFARAISESGLAGAVQPLSKGEENGVAFAQAQKTDIAGLRALSADALLAAAKTGRFGLVIDGSFLPASPQQIYAMGQAADVPILVGMTNDEMTGLNPPPATDAGLTAQLTRGYGAMAPRFQSFYPAATDSDRLTATHAIPRDLGLANLLGWARNRLAHSSAPVYGYLYTHVEPGPEAARYGAFHTSEVPYVFETLNRSPERSFSDVDQRVSNRLATYWVNFMKTGNPNGPGLPTWPALTIQSPQIMELGDDAKVRPLLPAPQLEAARDFLDKGGVPSQF
jgi:para-nitrobenzyl esterase